MRAHAILRQLRITRCSLLISLCACAYADDAATDSESLRRLPPVSTTADLPSPPPEQIVTPPDERQGHVLIDQLDPPPIPTTNQLDAPAISTTLPCTVPRANNDVDAQKWLQEYWARIAQLTDDPVQDPGGTQESLPERIVPWWDRRVKEPAGLAQLTLPVSIDQLVQGALQYSSYVKVISAEPWIQRSEIVREQAEFDWRLFLESTYDDKNDPVGSELTTGNDQSRFKDRTLSGETGLRRRNLYGGRTEVTQQLGGQRNNSRFLDPNPQSTALLELRYTQPLLNGAGRCYNESRVVLARIGTNAAEDQLARELQSHLLQVTEAYWDLYLARAEYFQRLRLLAGAQSMSGDSRWTSERRCPAAQGAACPGCRRHATLRNRSRPDQHSQHRIALAAARQ